nr:hypothetical protein [Tanacetum cinerariifolium]
DAIVHVAAMTAIGVNGQAIAKGLAQESEVARAEDHVIGVVHHGNFLAGAEVVLQCIQADLIDQLQQAAAIGAGAPHRDHLFGHVAVEVALQCALEERCQAGAFADRQQGVVEVDVAFFAEVAGQFLQYQLIEGGAVGDALHVGLDHFVQIGDRGVEVHRRVDQQHFLEVEAATGFVELADKGCRAARRRKRSMTKSLGKEVLLRYAGYDTGVVPKCRAGKQAGALESGPDDPFRSIWLGRADRLGDRVLCAASGGSSTGAARFVAGSAGAGVVFGEPSGVRRGDCRVAAGAGDERRSIVVFGNQSLHSVLQ